MNQYQIDRQRGAAAKAADLPFDPTESPGWIIGYGDAILIEPCPPPRPEDDGAQP